MAEFSISRPNAGELASRAFVAAAPAERSLLLFRKVLPLSATGLHRMLPMMHAT
jgi:hypothetical protein